MLPVSPKIKLPVPSLMRPPVLPGAGVRDWARATVLEPVSMVAPAFWTVTVVRPEKRVKLLAVSWRVPPLKLSVDVPVPVTEPVERVPPVARARVPAVIWREVAEPRVTGPARVRVAGPDLVRVPAAVLMRGALMVASAVVVMVPVTV